MEPFQFQIAVVLEEHVGNDGNYLTAPAGKRMVIEHASVDADPNTAADYYIVCTLVDTSTFIQFPIVTAKTATGRFIGSHPLRAYAAPGSLFGGLIRRDEASKRHEAVFVVAGYYVPVP